MKYSIIINLSIPLKSTDNQLEIDTVHPLKMTV